MVTPRGRLFLLSRRAGTPFRTIGPVRCRGPEVVNDQEGRVRVLQPSPEPLALNALGRSADRRRRLVRASNTAIPYIVSGATPLMVDDLRQMGATPPAVRSEAKQTRQGLSRRYSTEPLLDPDLRHLNAGPRVWSRLCGALRRRIGVGWPALRGLSIACTAGTRLPAQPGRDCLHSRDAIACTAGTRLPAQPGVSGVWSFRALGTPSPGGWA